MTRLQALALLTCGVLAGTLLAVLGTAAPAVAATGCTGALGPGQVRFTWVGGDGAWTDPAHWQVAGAAIDHDVPTYYGNRPETDDSTRGFVCIQPASPVTITLDGNAHVHVLALDVANATLVATGARVMVYGAAASHGSTIHPSATLRLRGSTLGGPGRIDVRGRVVWGETGFGVGTLDNDHCADFPAGEAVAACPAATTGTLRVDAGGLVEVLGRGVNLSDGYTVRVASGGRLRIAGPGYVAADRDTTIAVETGGVVELAGDASVFEGKPNGRPATDLAAFDNRGTVLKSAGAGASALNVAYDAHAGQGRVEVRAGGLSIAGATPVTADLSAGARLGTASCGGTGPATDLARPCVPGTSATDPQIAVLAPQQAAAGVVLQEGTTITQTGDLQPAVSIVSPPVVATLHLEVRDARPAAELVVFRSRPGLQERIPLCGAGGALPPGVTACIVGRRGGGGVSQLQVVTTDPAGLWSLRPSAVDFVRLVDPLVGAREGCAVSQPAYPFVAHEQIRLARSGVYSVHLSPVENAPTAGPPVFTGLGGPGVTTVPIPVTSSGWVAVVATGANGLPESTGSFRVVATPAVAFRKRSRAAVAGRPFVIEGRVRPKGRRTVELYAVRLTGRSGVLARTAVKARTDKKGRFRVVHRPKKAGRWVYAVRVRGKGGLSAAMSRQAVRVTVRRPAPRPAPPTVVRNVRAAETTTTGQTASPVDPLDLIGPFYPGRRTASAPACRFQVAR
ncbi:hypothetical protein [Nocardioides humi]|uniref:Uncharacterized protein n=1 Tax=Nocardioides humi TaxID=449461 RepID=A0ABN2BGR1_9ACTN|nr:hypothetical protein [Nocardioides humi]